MSESNFLAKLKELNFQITPGALEVIKTSHMPFSDLIANIQDSWEGEERIITVKEAINLMVRSREDMVISREIATEIKARKEYVPIPRQFRRTYTILKRFDRPVTAGYISRITHRKKNTEEIYLNQLVIGGFAIKERTKGQKARYRVTG